MEIPMTASAIADAKAFGQSHDQSAVFQLPGYDFDTGDNFKPSISITTPWLTTAFAAANARSRYSAISPILMKQIRATRNFTVDARTFSESLHANDDTVIVIKQDDKVIQAVERRVADEQVTETPVVGYRTRISCDFSAKKVNIHRPFTVVVGNVWIGLSMGEVTFDVDPTSMK
jgi:hypothetical protein